jgi:uncharacterized protein YdaU (DUF1376 family)
MPFYVGDYQADTQHLTTLEHGAYMLLIMHYWRHGELPDNDSALAKIAKLRIDKWKRLAPTIRAFFVPHKTIFMRDGFVPLKGNFLRHKRVEAELAKYREKIDKRAAAGKKGGEKKLANARVLLKQNPTNQNQIKKEREDSSDISAVTPRAEEPKKENGEGGEGKGLAGGATALYSEEDVAAAKLAFPLIDVDYELTRLIPWAQRNFTHVSEQKRKIAKTLSNKQAYLALAPKNLADRDAPVTVSQELLNSRLVKGTAH